MKRLVLAVAMLAFGCEQQGDPKVIDYGKQPYTVKGKHPGTGDQAFVMGSTSKAEAGPMSLKYDETKGALHWKSPVRLTQSDIPRKVQVMITVFGEKDRVLYTDSAEKVLTEGEEFVAEKDITTTKEEAAKITHWAVKAKIL